MSITYKEHYQKCPVCRYLKTFAGNICPGCAPFFTENADGKFVRKEPLHQMRVYHMYKMANQYPYNRTKFKQADLSLMRNFIVAHEHLDRAEFELKVNRMFIDQPGKPKNYVAIMELLTVCNTACYTNTPVTVNQKEVPMGTKKQTVAPAPATSIEQAEIIATKVDREAAIAAAAKTIKAELESPQMAMALDVNSVTASINVIGGVEITKEVTPQTTTLYVTDADAMPPSKTPDSIYIGQQIRERREALGLKREALAVQLGITPGYLGLIENGGPTWLSERLVAILGGLGITFDPVKLASKNAAAKAYDRAAAIRAKANKAKAARKAARAKSAKKAQKTKKVKAA